MKNWRKMFKKLLGSPAPFENDLEEAVRAEDEKERRHHIQHICKRVNADINNSRQHIQVMLKRMLCLSQTISLQTLTLLDTCIENCNPRFRVDFFTSEPLIGEFESLEKKVKPAVALDMRTKLKKWAEKYPYPLIETLNEKLQAAEANSKARKHAFPTASNKKNTHNSGQRSSSSRTTCRNEAPAISVLPSLKQLEEDDLARALQSSLKEHASYSTPTAPTLDAAVSTDGRSKRKISASRPLIECPICMDSDETADIVAAKCGHLYHHDCIQRWLDGSDDCPNCRVKITKESLLKIYVPFVACNNNSGEGVNHANQSPSTSAEDQDNNTEKNL